MSATEYEAVVGIRYPKSLDLFEAAAKGKLTAADWTHAKPGDVIPAWVIDGNDFGDNRWLIEQGRVRVREAAKKGAKT